MRWSSLVAGLGGLAYWVILLEHEPAGAPGSLTWITVGDSLLFPIVIWIVQYVLLRFRWATRNEWAVAGVVVLLVGWMVRHFVRQVAYPQASTRMICAGLAVNIGVIVLLNLWAIVWPARRRLAKPQAGAFPAPEMVTLTRQAELADGVAIGLSVPVILLFLASLFVGAELGARRTG